MPISIVTFYFCIVRCYFIGQIYYFLTLETGAKPEHLTRTVVARLLGHKTHLLSNDYINDFCGNEGLSRIIQTDSEN